MERFGGGGCSGGGSSGCCGGDVDSGGSRSVGDSVRNGNGGQEEQRTFCCFGDAGLRGSRDDSPVLRLLGCAAESTS